MVDNQHLARELIERAGRDQQARLSLPHRHTMEWQQVVAPVDGDNASRIAEIIDVHGWPGHALVGQEEA